VDGWILILHISVSILSAVCGSRMLVCNCKIWVFGSYPIIGRHKFIILAC